MSARRRKAREKAAAQASELWCHSRRIIPAGEGHVRASDGRVEPDRATFSSSGTEESGACFANSTLRTSPKNATHRRGRDGIFRCTHEKTANRRTTAACSPHESPDDRSGNNGNTIRNVRHGRSADRRIRPRRRISTEKREAAQSGDLPSGSYSVPTPKDIPASCSFFIPAKTVPRRGRSCRLPHFSGHRRGFFAARRTRRPGFVSAVRDLRNAVRRQATRCPRTSISNESPFLNTSACPPSKS